MKGSILRALGRYDEAIANCRQACQFPNAPFGPQLFLASILVTAEQLSEAQSAFGKAIQLEPALSVGFLRDVNPGAHETYLESLIDSLTKTGLLE
jgi:tetratricopeptide (TPR) repeat protein